MRLIFSKRHTGAKEVLGIQANINFKLVLKSFTLLLTISAILSGCTARVAPAKSGVPLNGSYDTTLFSITYLEGVRQKMLGNSGDAINYFERALEINSGSDGAAYEISRISLGQGDLESAARYAKIANSIDDENRWYLNHLATIYFAKRRIDSVIIVFEKIVTLYPEDEDILFNLGGLYLETGQAEKAEEIFSEFRSRYGDNEQIVIALLNSMNAQNKAIESEKLLLTMIERDPDNTTFKGMLAENYRKYGDRNRAIEIYGELFEKDPNNPLLRLSYIDFLIEDERLEELALIVDQAMLNDSIEKESKINILITLSESNNYVASYRNRLILSALLLEATYSDDPDVIYAVSKVYGKIGDREKEIEELKKRAEKGGGNYAYWEELLIKINEAGDMELLYTISDRVSREFNIYPLPKLLFAFAATDRGEYDLALSELVKVRILINEQKEFMIQILSLEADIYYRKGNYNEAFLRFEEALEINPDDAMILNNYAYFLSEQDSDLKKAEQLIERCLNIDKNSTYLDTHAWVLFKLKKYKRAEKVMKEIFLAKVEDAELLEHYGYIHKALGNCNEAVRLWNLSLISDSTKSYLIDEIDKCSGKR